MAGTETVKAALWLEGLRSFRRHWQDTRRWLVWFFILIPVGYLALWQMGTYSIGNPAVVSAFTDLLVNAKDHDYVKSHQGAVADTLKSLPRPKWPVHVAGIASALLLWAQTYLFYGFFMKREGMGKNFRPGWKQGFAFFFKVIQWWLLVMLLFLAAAAVIALTATLLFLLFHIFLPVDIRKIFSTIVFLVACGAAFAAMMCILIRYALVFSLAAGGIEPALAASVRLTRGNIWRMFWNGLLIYLFFIPLFIALFALFIGSGALVSGNIPLGILMGAFYAALTLLMVGICASFNAAACRILYEENRQSDPSFSLTTPAL